jgi:hypothetical protein
MTLGIGAPLPVVAAATVASGVALDVQAVTFPTAMQSAIAPEVLARVTAIDLLGSEGGQPVGYALAGPIGHAAAPHTVLAAAAISMFLATSAFPLPPPLRAEPVGHPRALREHLFTGLELCRWRFTRETARTAPSAKSSAAELREHGSELDRGFGQAVARPLAGSRVLTGVQSQLDESLKSVGENIGGDLPPPGITVSTSGCKPQAEGVPC